MERLITNSIFFPQKKRNYIRFSFLLQLRVSSFKIKREKESRGNLPTSFSYLRRRLPENFCDWSLLVLFLIRELVFCKFSPLLFILKLSILQKHQHGLPFLRRAQCLLKPGHEKKIWTKQIYKKRLNISVTGRWRSCCSTVKQGSFKHLLCGTFYIWHDKFFPLTQ